MIIPQRRNDGTLVKTQMQVKLGGMVATLLGDLAEMLFQKNIENFRNPMRASQKQKLLKNDKSYGQVLANEL